MDSNEGSGWAFDGFGNLYDFSQPMDVETYGPPPLLRWVAPVDLPHIFGMPCAVAGRIHRVKRPGGCDERKN